MKIPSMLAAVSLLAAACGCIDMTPASERDRVLVVAPETLRASVELALATFADLQAPNPYRVRYVNCAEVARLASSGEAALALTLHPAWADYIRDRGSVDLRGSVAIDALVVAGAPGSAGNRVADPGELLALPGSIAVPSTESEAVGMYAREALIRYGIWSQLEPRLVVYPSAEGALAAVRAGEASAAFAAGSAALDAGHPVLLTLDEAFHQPLLVEVLLMGDARPEARSLYDYLIGPQGVGAFISQGLRPANP